MSSTDHATGDAHDVDSHDAHGVDSHDAHGVDAHDAHDHEPAPPPEPESPAWLPLLGGGLFLLALLAFLFTRTPEPGATTEAAAADGVAAARPKTAVQVAAPSDAPLRPRAFPSNPEIRALADKMRAPGAAPAPNPGAPNPAMPPLNRPPAPPAPPAGH